MADHVRLNETRRYSVDLNSLASQFTCQALSERDNRSLSRRVVRLPKITSLTDDGRNIDDPPPSLANHVLGHELSRVKNAVQIHAHDLVPHGLRHFQERLV